VFWRAGFGATPREARHWARRGKGATIHWLLNGGPSPAPRIKGARIDGHHLDPENEWGHDVLWWLDRMIRSRHPLEEKLTLFWHDHFATTEQDTPLMLAQNKTLRRHALGRFPDLLEAVTRDPAMLLFLSLANSDKEAPNENYARELMELFTLGHGYSERDIRQAARALTGFKAEWHDNGNVKISYDREWHDAGAKRVLGKVGRFDWKDVLDLCVRHPAHAPACASGRWSERSSPTRPCTGTWTRPRWSSRRWCSWPARCARPARASSATPGPGCSTRWGSTRSARRRSPAGTGARAGCRRTRCACASTSRTT
jgi:hypothetical protein